MPQYFHPGVYIEEIERGPRPIEGVPTSIAALLGEAERGPVTPQLVTSYRDYQRWFGDVFGDQKFLPYAANGFFGNGGTQAYICRIVGTDGKTAESAFGDFFSVRAAGPGAWGNRVFVKISDGSTIDQNKHPVGIRVQVAYWSALPDTAYDPFIDAKSTPRPTYTEDFDDLVAD